MAMQYQEIPEELARDGSLGIVSQMKEQKKDFFKATNLYLDLMSLPGAGIVSNIWRRGGPETLTRSAVLKGLAQDVRAMPKELVDKDITRGIYKSLHKVPEEVLIQPDQYAMRLKLPSDVPVQRGVTATDEAFTYGLQQYYPLHPKTGTPVSSISFKISDPLAGKSGASINDTIRKYNMIKSQAASHELAHTIQMNPLVQRRLGLSSELKDQLKDLNKINWGMDYSVQPLENISRGMEDLADATRGKITKKKFLKEFKELTDTEHKIHMTDESDIDWSTIFTNMKSR